MFSKIITRSMTTTKFSGIYNVTIIGGGQMGAGIGQVAAATNHRVTIVDQNEKLLQKSKDGISRSTGRIIAKKYADDAAKAEKKLGMIMNNITITTDMEKAVQTADIVIEAIVEDLDIKKKLFAKLDEMTPATTIFASNTSSYRIGMMASVTKRPERFAGLHFFNPVPMMKLLEIVHPESLSPDVSQRLREFGKALGKVTVDCKDTPGFIVNRLYIPLMYQALFMYLRGDATIDDINTAMKFGAGFPMGPFTLMDLVGLDLMDATMRDWVRDYPDEPTFQASDFLPKMVAEGKCGVKTGEGFFKYDKK